MQIASRQPLWDGRRVHDGRTMLALRAGPCMTARIAVGRLAPGSRSVTVDWGDGTVETLPGIDGRTHTYAAEREYRVAISDDLASFGYTAFRVNDEGSRDMLREVISVGRKVASITNYGFNNCHNLRGVIELPGVTEIGSYAFGSAYGITDFILPSLPRLSQAAFYCNPSPTQIHADNATRIDQWFWDFYGPHLRDIYLRTSTCKRILAMGGFPFRAPASARFHGSDGTVLGNRTVVRE